MKLKLILFSAIFCLASGIFAQVDITPDIQAALKSGYAGALADHFTESIDLTIIDEDGAYSKAQAEQILKKFFEENKPLSFTIKHSGSSQRGDQYKIGDLKTTKGSYRVSIYIRKQGDRNQIFRLWIEENEE